MYQNGKRSLIKAAVNRKKQVVRINYFGQVLMIAVGPKF